MCISVEDAKHEVSIIFHDQSIKARLKTLNLQGNKTTNIRTLCFQQQRSFETNIFFMWPNRTAQNYHLKIFLYDHHHDDEKSVY